MLQQTTVTTVIPYYHRWIKLFPTIQHVARSPIRKILKTWQGLGYYQRARNIHQCAQIICRQFDGQIPAEKEILQTLPGFGPYTTGAVLSIAFDQRQPIIDANIRRVVMRQQGIRAKAEPAVDDKILKFLDFVMPRQGNNIFNQSLMELGALVCRPREPLCVQCPIQNSCAAYQQGMQDSIPQPKKQILEDVRAVVAVLRQGKRYFIQKRDEKGLLAGLWEFPGGKIKKGENPRQALHRELKEELGVRITSCRHLSRVQHFYTRFRVTLEVYSCKLKNNPRADSRHHWITFKDFEKYPMPAGTIKIIKILHI